MRIDWSTLALQTVNALVLVWLLARFLFRPVGRIIAERQASALALIADADSAKLAAEKELDALTTERAQLVSQRTQALVQVEVDAEKLRAALLAAAREEVDRRRAQVAAEMARDRAAQAEATSALAVQLAIDIAGKLLDRVSERMRVTAFVDGLVEGIRSLSPGAQAGMASDTSLQLTVPRPLTPEEQAQCEAALSAALGHPASLKITVDESLIAGLELSGTHGLVRNSWRDQLEQIQTALLHDNGHAR
ncbi:F0F1 ATP synthase subunit delta [Paraburkholderia hospita]|uniref:F0F1 ATP synthase subunit delta n=1 Tax=Paraburkholderia hospita TaxID=169430 RepID=UPI000B34969B|nr:F0F1 ATP synthase subunit delta [Paraburkholderia hospita]OUL95655.1 F0F1 ATP synthase subunit B [Paraburkholderia hospita]